MQKNPLRSVFMREQELGQPLHCHRFFSMEGLAISPVINLATKQQFVIWSQIRLKYYFFMSLWNNKAGLTVLPGCPCTRPFSCPIYWVEITLVPVSIPRSLLHCKEEASYWILYPWGRVGVWLPLLEIKWAYGLTLVTPWKNFLLLP